MKISLKTLGEYLDLEGLSIKEIVDTITVKGVEIEGVEKLAQGDHLVIGKVLECEKHPDSDHLHVCKVDVGTGISTIVCGAPNVAKGQKVIVSLPGAHLPAKGIVIQKGVIRGVPSEGMICSLLELGVSEKYLSEEQKSGIEVLANDAPVGNNDPLAYLGLDDTLLELKPTPNRGDVLSFISFVYEASAALNRPLKKDLEPVTLSNQKEATYTIKSETSKCPRAALKAVYGCKIKPSPRWLQAALMSYGVRSINNVVDIGNYVMLLVGQPLHMYDAKKLVSHDFVIKCGYKGPFKALDEQVYQLLEDDILVTNGDQNGCLAGIMGSDATKIDDNTTDIVIESAEFNDIQIRTTARRLLLLSEAATRFIRGIDYTRSCYALDLACQLLIELADAKTIEKTTTFGDFTPKDAKVNLSLSKTNAVLGTSFTLKDLAEVFTRLRFDYSMQGDNFLVSIPSYRNDITISEDLIEEVIRIKGFENLKETYPTDFTTGGYNARQHQRLLVREHLVEQGLYESLTYSLENAKYSGDFNVLSINKGAKPIKLLSPITVDHEVLRQSLIPSLLGAINGNNVRSIKDVAFFEVSKMYYNDKEYEQLGIAISGHLKPNKWPVTGVSDFYTVKGLVISVLNLLGIQDTRYSLVKVEPDNPYFHPGKSAYLKSGNTIFGVIGEVHPNMLKKYEVSPTVVAELDLAYLLDTKTSKIKFSAPSIYPPITRDIAVVIKDEIESADLIRVIKKSGKALVKNAEVFDIYQGSNLDEGYKSVAITISYEDAKKTLTDAEVNAVHTLIIEALEKTFNAKLRA